MSTPQTWKVTPEQYAGMIQQVNEAGVHITGNSGETTKQGVTIAWEYDGKNLSITVKNRSWYDPSIPDLEAKVKSAVDEALASNSAKKA
jgi:hypothetical protein